MRLVRSLLLLSLLAPLAGCALIDALGSADDDDGEPEPDVDGGPEPVLVCDQAIRLGNVTAGASIGPFDSCEFDFDIEMSLACGQDNSSPSGLLFRFSVDVPQEYVVCSTSNTDSSGAIFIVSSAPCSDRPLGDCISVDGTAGNGSCTQMFLAPGAVHVYWEPLDSCTSMGFDIFRAAAP